MGKTYLETADIETASDGYAARFSGTVGEYFLAVQRDIVLRYLSDLTTENLSILDVGGGHAQLARPLIDSGYRVTVTGSDDICRTRLDSSCEKGSFSYQTCDSLNLPFADKSFDVVISFRLLPHAERWEKLVQEMCRVAKTSVIFDYPDRRSTNILYDLLFEFKKNMEGNTRTYTLFTRRQITQSLQTAGFSFSRFTPEFFWPMVLHRKLKCLPISRSLEALPRYLGLTKLLGSPIIVSSKRAE